MYRPHEQPRKRTRSGLVLQGLKWAILVHMNYKNCTHRSEEEEKKALLCEICHCSVHFSWSNGPIHHSVRFSWSNGPIHHSVHFSSCNGQFTILSISAGLMVLFTILSISARVMVLFTILSISAGLMVLFTILSISAGRNGHIHHSVHFSWS